MLDKLAHDRDFALLVMGGWFGLVFESTAVWFTAIVVSLVWEHTWLLIVAAALTVWMFVVLKGLLAYTSYWAERERRAAGG